MGEYLELRESMSKGPEVGEASCLKHSKQTSVAVAKEGRA